MIAALYVEDAQEGQVTEDQQRAIEEFQACAKWLLEAEPDQVAGRRYALEMAAAECRLLGLDPSRITPDGYVGAFDVEDAASDLVEVIDDWCRDLTDSNWSLLAVGDPPLPAFQPEKLHELLRPAMQELAHLAEALRVSGRAIESAAETSESAAETSESAADG